VVDGLKEAFADEASFHPDPGLLSAAYLPTNFADHNSKKRGEP
jgi:hypothetical protein